MIFLCYIVILPLHETSTYVGVVIIRYNNFAAVVYDGSYLFIEIRYMFTIKSHVKRKFLEVMICKIILYVLQQNDSLLCKSPYLKWIYIYSLTIMKNA